MTFDDLCALLLEPPTATLHARVRWSGDTDRSWYVMGGRYAWGPGPWAPERDDGGEGVLELWKDGGCLRVEVNGQPRYLCDGEQAWRFDDDPQCPVTGSPREVRYTGTAYWLVSEPGLPVADADEESHVDEDTCAGRPAWKVTAGDVVAWVDRETCHMLALGFTDDTFREELVDAAFGTPLDAGLFTWDGPTMSTHEQWRRSQDAIADTARTRMTAHIASDLSPVAVTLELTPTSVPEHDDVTGEFRAYGEGFSLTRSRLVESRGKSSMTDPSAELHRWSTPDFEWELTVGGLVSVDRAGMAALWEQLHPGVPVDRYSRYQPEA